LSCSSLSEIFLFACNWLANFSFSFLQLLYLLLNSF
jgi:hypothetical protein